MRINALIVAVLVIACTAFPAAAQETPANVKEALSRADAAVQKIIDVRDDQRTFTNTVEALDDMFARLETDTNMTMFLAYVSQDADERAAGLASEVTVTNWHTDLGKNEALYEAIKGFAESNPSLDSDEKRLLEFTLRDFRRDGMNLSPAKRDALAKIQKQLNEISIEFDTNLREDATHVPLTRRELPGMDGDYRRTLEKSGDIYLVGMSYPKFVPLMNYCEDETTRKKVWIAYKRRGGTKNVEVLERILKLRAQEAALLGYAHPADYETEVKMAKNAAAVSDFYERLRPLVRTKALVDHEEFLTAKRRATDDEYASLYPWDTSFYKNLLMKEKYSVDTQKVREYFPLQRCTEGLFSITQSLYGLEYRDVTASAASRGMPLWHEDVKLYEVWDIETGDKLGMFYTDLHPRENKYGHAAQWGLSQHKVWSDGKVTRPLASLVCNFTKPTADRPSLLSHDEVETYFHEFGHCLHTLLSKSRFYRFSGTSVERDFVEAPSQMFENWVWSPEVLRTFSAHYRTGEPLPDKMLDGMIAAKNLGSGMLAERQFFYGLFDMTCHLDPTGEIDTTQLGHDLWDPEGMNIELYDPVSGTFFQAAFGHLTGYQAGYYGYQWSLVYACDMFQRFNELGLLSPSAGRYYRDKILSRGGTMDGLDLVRDYLGREPDLSAYLEHLGLEDN